jgi:heme-degrading monooxygenase HmoA
MQQKGFVGIKLFIDRKTGKGVVVSRWQSEADLEAGEASGYYQEQIAKVAPFLTAPPTRETFELAAEGGA